MFEDQCQEMTKKICDLFSRVLDKKGEDNHNNDHCTMFWKLWPEAIETKVEKLSSTIDDTNVQNEKSYKRVVIPVSKSEYLIFHSLLSASTEHF